MALVRVCLALLILADLAIRFGMIDAFYGERGVLPRAAALKHTGSWRFSLHLLNGHIQYQVLLFVITGLAGLALLVGYRTRLATIVCWVLLVSLDNRNRLLVHAGNVLLVVLLFWSMFLPLGSRFSLDAALKSGARPKENHYLSVATAAFLLQAVYVYVFGAIIKTDSASWIPDGDGIYYALSMDRLVLPFGIWLATWPTVLKMLSYFVWSIELLAPVLMFFPWFNTPIRLVTLTLLIAMHIGFYLCLKIGLFPFVSITSLLAFTPGSVWDWLAARRRSARRSGIRIYYDGECDFCRKTCLILRAFCLPETVPIRPAQSEPEALALMEKHDSWVVYDSDGEVYLRWQAVNFILKMSPIFWPIGHLLDLGIWAKPLDRLYGVIGRNRMRLGPLAARWLPYRPIFERPSAPTTVFLSLAALGVFYYNLARLDQITLPLPDWLRDASYSVNLSQKWSMFATPGRRDGWLVVEGLLEDGTIVDPYRGEMTPPSFEKPDDVASYYGNYRWRKYLYNLSRSRFKKYRKYYVDYLCDRWNSSHNFSSHLAEVAVYFMEERTPPPGEFADQPKRRRLIRRSCKNG